MEKAHPIIIKRDESKNWLLWWSPGESQKFYPISYNQIQAAAEIDNRSPEERFASYRQKMDRVFRGSEELFWGVYNRNEKTLQLKAENSEVFSTLEQAPTRR